MWTSSLVDRIVRSAGGDGFGRSRRLRESAGRLTGAEGEAVDGYVGDACALWHASHATAPPWMLPMPDELAPIDQFAPGTRFRPQPREFQAALRKVRSAAQPPLQIGGACLPGSGVLRTTSTFDIPDLPPRHEETFEKWFASPGDWQSFARQLHDLTHRRLSTGGLVWRQHRVRPAVDGLDLRDATPGTRFTLPYPVSCRSLPHPLGSIFQPLARRADLLAGKPEDVVYLEIWATTGAALPARRTTQQDENEVLLPAGSAFEVVRHVDLLYVKEPDLHSRVESAHGVQLIQK